MIHWRLSELMARHRIKGSLLADWLDVTPTTISKWKNAPTMPQMDGAKLDSLLNALNLARDGGSKIQLSDLIEYKKEEEA